MPCVTVCPTPKGLPIAITKSPTSRWSESPIGIGAMSAGLLILSTARSVRGSRSTNCASNSRLSASATFTSFMFSMTWLLVMTRPEASTITPEPRERCARSPGMPPGPRPGRSSPKKRRMNSSMALERAERFSTCEA
ncbi:hypothetical protein CHKEEEPN_4029 [Methylorubrum podarium]|nr:hypothetical protein CHKEEEPN_4029 [Methylorubrum podarium]